MSSRKRLRLPLLLLALLEAWLEALLERLDTLAGEAR